jgi:hypothetical protein
MGVVSLGSVEACHAKANILTPSCLYCFDVDAMLSRVSGRSADADGGGRVGDGRALRGRGRPRARDRADIAQSRFIYCV